MKSKKIANICMICAIVLIVLSGILVVLNIQGQFDKLDSDSLLLTDCRGIIMLERNGISYTTSDKTVLREDDRITCKTGSTAKVLVNDGYLILGEGSQIEIAESVNSHFVMNVDKGEVFVNVTNGISLEFDGKKIDIADAVACLSVRKGAQSISVYSGNVLDAQAGQIVEWIHGEVSVRECSINSLNDFNIAQIRKINETKTLFFSNEELDELETMRLAEMSTDFEFVQDEKFDEKIQSGDMTESDEATKSDEATESDETAKSDSTKNADDSEHKKEQKSDETKKSEKTQKSEKPEKTPWSEKTKKPKKNNKTETTNPGSADNTNTIEHPENNDISDTTTNQKTKNNSEINKNPGNSKKPEVINKPVATNKPNITNKPAATKKPNITNKPAATNKPNITNKPTATNKPVATNKPAQDSNNLSCTITIRCDTILDNRDNLEPSKSEFVPENGCILPSVKVEFDKDDTVFDVLKEVCETYKIQIEYSWTPMYESYYIEGINNLYEFDCGYESGWMYKVNGWFPNYGCSSYELKDGDNIVWCYTCVGLGADVGAEGW